MNIQLSIVIVEYQCVEEIKNCVTALKQQLNIPYEILISSNSCYDEQQKKQIGNEDPHVRWLFNARNGGFAYAMNEGLKVAQGDYLVIMNSDCTLKSSLEGMIGFMERHPEVGAIAPMMKDPRGNIQDTARPYVSLPRYIWRQTKRVLANLTSILNNKMDYSRIQTVDWVIGAFIMVSRKAYLATNGLDERFFMYAEDLDWCTRIRQQGFEIVYYPKAVITYEGSRRARKSWKYAKIFITSHVAYWKKFGFCYGYPPRIQKTFDE